MNHSSPYFLFSYSPLSRNRILSTQSLASAGLTAVNCKERIHYGHNKISSSMGAPNDTLLFYKHFLKPHCFRAKADLVRPSCFPQCHWEIRKQERIGILLSPCWLYWDILPLIQRYCIGINATNLDRPIFHEKNMNNWCRTHFNLCPVY